MSSQTRGGKANSDARRRPGMMCSTQKELAENSSRNWQYTHKGPERSATARAMAALTRGSAGSGRTLILFGRIQGYRVAPLRFFRPQHDAHIPQVPFPHKS